MNRNAVRNVFLCAVVVAGAAASQDSRPTTPSATENADPIAFAVLEPDGYKRVRVAEAAEALAKATPEARARFVAARGRVAASVSGADSRAAESRAAAPPTRGPEFAPAIKLHMRNAAFGEAAASEEALRALAEAGDDGKEALFFLDVRTQNVIGRAISEGIKKGIASRTLFAGQYAALKEFGPDAFDLLVEWASRPPRDVGESQADSFRSAAVRALRDVEPPKEVLAVIVPRLRAAVQRAGEARNEDLVFTLAGALRAFGDPKFFDALLGQATERTKSEDPRMRFSGFGAVAELNYAARRYGDAADAYRAQLAAATEAKVPETELAIRLYNCACVESLAERPDQAFETLERAIKAGKANGGVTKSLLTADRDLAAMRSDPRFAKLVETYFGEEKP